MDVLADLLGQSPEITAVRDQLRRLLGAWSRARRSPPVLVQGETGTGKGLLARALHRDGPRGDGPFIDLNCASIPESLLEAELFGYERGAFTDARQAKPGLFHLAHRGTLFLDEIGLLPLSLQGKLLAVLEDRAVRRLGGSRTEPADVWVIAATNEDLALALRERRFRSDLYHRLAVVTLTLPPLRERGDDAILLAEHFLGAACAAYGLPRKTLGDDARDAIRGRAWPGNVRELSNAIERAALTAAGATVGAGDLALLDVPEPDAADVAGDAAAPPAWHDALRDHLERVLTESDWNISRTAAILGLSRNTVAARIARFGLRGPRKSGTPQAGDDRPRRAPAPARWETRRITLLRVDGGAESEAAMSPRVDAAIEKLRGFGGRVEGLGPGLLLATFGIEPRDESAVLAGHAALVFRHATAALPRPPLVRMGLHTVEIAVRVGDGPPLLDADASRRAWTAVASATEAAAPGAIVATPAAAALLRRRFALTAADADARTYVVHGVGRSPLRGARDLFAGRREELALLERLLRAASEGSGQAVAIVGESGIGKSRLAQELIARARMDGITCLAGACLPAEVPRPFGPWIEIAAQACGVAEADVPEVVERKVRAAFAPDEPHVGETVASLTYLLGAERRPPEIPGPAVKKRLFAAIERLLVAKSAGGPVVALIDDVQWIDPTSDGCLTAIVQTAARARLLVATTARTGHRPAWAGAAHAHVVGLPPLSADESLAIIRGVLDERGRAEALERKIQAWAEGNPLFIEELSRAALESGDGSLGPRIPATIEDAIETRLARLSPGLRRILASCAVIGREVPLALLDAVTEIGAAAVDTATAQLERGDFLYRTADGEPRAVFKHALVQETAYAKLTASERRTLHGRTLEAIERLHRERIADHVERLAHHAVLAEAHDRAVDYVLQAGRKAAARFALAEAMGHLDKGLALLPRLPEGAERDRRELGLRVAAGMVLSAGQGPAAPETRSAWARAMELRGLVGDAPELAALLIGQWYRQVLGARYGEAQRIAEEMRALAARDGDTLLGAVAHQCLGMTALYRGEHATARVELERAIRRYDPEAHRARIATDSAWPMHVNQRVTALAYLGRVLWALGYPDQARARNREALAHAQAWGGALNRAIALGMLTAVHQLRREPGAVRATGEESIAHAAEWGITYWVAQGTLLTAAAADEGVTAEMERGLAGYRATGTTLGLTWFLALQADALLAEGRLDDARRAVDEALALSESMGERYHLAEAVRVKGRVLEAARARGGAESAEPWFRRAIEIAREQDAKGWELRAATDLARLLARERREAEARATLSPVYAWFTEGHDTADLREARALLDALA